jgi:hypothetical protein
MEIIEIDAIGAEPLERAIERARDRRRAAVEGALAVDQVEHALARQREFAAAMHHRLGEQPLVAAAAIERRGVEQGHPQVERAPEQADPVRLRYPRAIGVAEVHAAQADGRDGEGSERARGESGHDGVLGPVTRRAAGRN